MKIFHPPAGKFCQSLHDSYSITLEKPDFLYIGMGLAFTNNFKDCFYKGWPHDTTH
ncbi:MAG TPA: hypothetical protein VMW78_06255 [Anaerolineae bacterium]|nr:hypothetical protein [Anaerolineae bacterium]